MTNLFGYLKTKTLTEHSGTLESYYYIFSMIEYAKMTNQINTLTKCLATFWSCERKDCPDSWTVILVKSWHYSHYIYIFFVILYTQITNLFGYLKTKTLTEHSGTLESYYYIFSMIEYAKMTNQSNTLTKCLATFWSCERKDCPDSWTVILVKSQHYSHYVYVVFVIAYTQMTNLFGCLKNKTLTKHSGSSESYYYFFFYDWVTRVNSTNVLDEGLRFGEIGRRMNPKVKSVKQGVYQN
jgi:hypothetical protein